MNWKEKGASLLNKAQHKATSNLIEPQQTEKILVEMVRVAEALFGLDPTLTFQVRIQNGFKLKGIAQTATVIEATINSTKGLAQLQACRKAATTTYNALILLAFETLTSSVQQHILLECAKSSTYLRLENHNLWIYFQSTIPCSTTPLTLHPLTPSVRNELKNWSFIHQSPYGLSFYNTSQVGWHQKPIGSLRLSNHWNFMSRNRLHCQTKDPIKKEWKNRFLLGVYTGDYYEIVKCLDEG